jgi:hypothetical protein
MRHIAFRVAALAFVFGHAISAQAKPNVMWSPQNVSEEILAGEEHEVTVELNIVEGRGNLTLRVVPALADVLTVEPAFIGFAEAGDTIEVTLYFAPAPDLDEGLLDGVVQVRSGRRTIAKPLPIVLNIITSPLQDVDNDNDGTWDDIQDFIDDNYGDDIDLRNGAVQFAHGLQNALLNAPDNAGSLTAATEIQRAVECLFALDGEEANTTRREIMAAFLNSDQRARAYMVFNAQLGGQVFWSRPLSELIASCNTE